MKYKHKIAGTRESLFDFIDLPIVFAMFSLIIMAWFATKIENSFIVKKSTFIPEFTIAGQLNVLPIADTEIKKDTAKVGSFVSISKTSVQQKPTKVEMSAIKNVIPVKNANFPQKVIAPRVIYKSIPDYPAKSVENSEQGTVIVSVLIQKNGKVGQTKIEQSSGFDLLDKSAINAVSQWIFEPANLSDQLTESWFTIPIKFKLKI